MALQATAQRTADLSKKEAFGDLFPKKFVFRSEPFVNNRPDAAYNFFENGGVFSAGFIQKYVNVDEVPNIIPGFTAGYAARYVKENPTKLVLNHWDAQEHVNNIPGSSDRYFPGHWCMYEGTTLTKALQPRDTLIHVQEVKPLAYPIRSPKARSKWLNPVLLVVELDREGKPLWDRYEYVEIKEIDAKTNTISIHRGTALSSPRGFVAGSRVAPISAYLGTHYLFAHNYATNAPRDKNGKTGIDIQLEEIKEFHDPQTGVLGALDGIGFDVLNWEPHNFRERIDSDGDGVADGGYDPVTGEDLWRRGAYEFQKRLRAHFGPDFVMINDGYSDTDQRAIGLFNGIESEGLVRHNDAFRGFSKALNVFDYWTDHNPMQYKLSYFVPKIMNPMDEPNADRLRRLCMATATCLGAGINLPPVRRPEDTDDEICAGKLFRQYWLGRPVEKMRNHALAAPDLLKGAGETTDAAFLTQWSVAGCHVQPEREAVFCSGLDKSRHRDHAVMTFKGFKVPEDVNDITVSFEIRAGEGLLGYEPVIPRMIRCKVAGLPKYEKGERENNMYNDMWGFFGVNDYTRVTFYYRNVAGLTLDFELTAEGQGDFSMRNFRIHSAVEAISRRFEHGIVLVNPSLNDYTFDLQALAKGKSYSRINGKGAPNNGAPVGDKVTLGPLEGLFLIERSKAKK